jgi:hypothetical protein
MCENSLQPTNLTPQLHVHYIREKLTNPWEDSRMVETFRLFSPAVSVGEGGLRSSAKTVYFALQVQA